MREVKDFNRRFFIRNFFKRTNFRFFAFFNFRSEDERSVFIDVSYVNINVVVFFRSNGRGFNDGIVVQFFPKRLTFFKFFSSVLNIFNRVVFKFFHFNALFTSSLVFRFSLFKFFHGTFNRHFSLIFLNSSVFASEKSRLLLSNFIFSLLFVTFKVFNQLFKFLFKFNFFCF